MVTTLSFALICLMFAAITVGAVIYGLIAGTDCQAINKALDSKVELQNRFTVLANLIVADESAKETGRIISDMRLAGRLTATEAIELYQTHCAETRPYRWLGDASVSPAFQEIIVKQALTPRASTDLSFWELLIG